MVPPGNKLYKFQKKTAWGIVFEGRERRLVIGKEGKVKQSYIVTFLIFLLTILAGTPLSWIKGIGRLFEGLGENSKYGQIYFMLKHLWLNKVSLKALRLILPPHASPSPVLIHPQLFFPSSSSSSSNLPTVGACSEQGNEVPSVENKGVNHPGAGNIFSLLTTLRP